jgi:hypothetical protein
VRKLSAKGAHPSSSSPRPAGNEIAIAAGRPVRVLASPARAACLLKGHDPHHLSKNLKQCSHFPVLLSVFTRPLIYNLLKRVY